MGGDVETESVQTMPSRKKLNEAKSLIIKAETLYPEYYLINLAWGQYYWGMGNFDKAGRCFKSAIEANPNHPEAYSRVSIILGQEGHVEDGEVMAAQAVKISPANPIYLSNLGNFKLQKGDYEMAEACYSDAITFDEENPIPHCGMAMLNYAKHDYAKAEQYAKRTIELNPNFAKAFSILSLINLVRGELADGYKNIRTALELDPMNKGYKKIYSDVEQAKESNEINDTSEE